MKQWFLRLFFYFIGLVILALGLILNTKADLGVSPIISVAYLFSVIMDMRFGDMTFIWYSILAIIEIIIHLSMHKEKQVIIIDILQVPFSVVFTRIMNLFSALIPVPDQIAIKFIFLVFAIIFTGIGAALSLNMRVIPNPGDGIVQAIADKLCKSVGLTKNFVDLTCICISIVLGLCLKKQIIGIGIGTIIAMLGVGRIIALFNHFTKAKLDKLTNIDPTR